MDEIAKGAAKKTSKKEKIIGKQRHPRKRAQAEAAAILRKTKKIHERAGSSTGAPHAALPAFVAPSLATLADKAPESDNWIHEIKFDGYRIQARLDGGKVKLLTRRGLDWTRKFPTIAEAIAKLPAKTALIDGELVVEGDDGISSFLAAAARPQGRPPRPHGVLCVRSDASRRRAISGRSRSTRAKKRWRGCWRRRQSAGRCA